MEDLASRLSHEHEQLRGRTVALAGHLQAGEADVNAIQKRDDVEEKKEWDQPAVDALARSVGETQGSG